MVKHKLIINNNKEERLLKKNIIIIINYLVMFSNGFVKCMPIKNVFTSFENRKQIKKKKNKQTDKHPKTYKCNEP